MMVKVDSGDTAWVLVSAALVMLMTPGLAFFYGGMVRKKNILSMLMQCFIIMGVIGLQWVLFGYSLSFGPGGRFWGGLQWFGLNGVGFDPYPAYAGTIPHQAFMIFQAMFAIITPALIVGAFAERMKFSAFLIFIVLWATFVYDPIAHWVWGDGGWLKARGALDFAGGTVVHINAGIAALAAAIATGRRRGYDNVPTPPHNLPFTVLGAGLLWFGWFGFNAGSALSINGVAVNALVTTNIAAAFATLSWMAVDWYLNGKPSATGAAIGGVCGLVAITPAAGFVDVSAAIAIGIVAGMVCNFVVILLNRTALDDTLDVFACHGVGGMWGAIATGIFAQKAVNVAGNNGLLFGNPKQVAIQALAVVAVAVWAFLMSAVILKVIDWTMGLRVSAEEEEMGLDLSQHGEYAFATD